MVAVLKQILAKKERGSLASQCKKNPPGEFVSRGISSSGISLANHQAGMASCCI
jgi:hypothetical protein